MEITVRKFDLLKELLLLQGAVERKATIPILANILLDASDGGLKLAATDMEIGLATSAPAKIKRAGACAVPARKLLDYVRLLPDAELTVRQLENHWVQLRCGRANTKMVAMARDNFPSMPPAPEVMAARIPAAALAEGMSKTIFAISNEESRYTLNGALLVLKPGALTLVATDGHRLAHWTRNPVELEGLSGEVRALVPRKAMAELLALLEQAPEGAKVEFAQDDTQLYFRIPSGAEGQRLLTARKLTGQFPNYEAVLPKQQQHSIALNREELSATLRRVAQFADERSHAVRLRVEKSKIVLASSSSDLGESDEELDTAYDGEPMVIGFNANYLGDFLDAVTTTEVLLEFNDEQSAGQLRPKESEGCDYRYVVMPMRI